MFSLGIVIDFMTIEEIRIMNEKRYRNKKKYKLLVIFSFFLLESGLSVKTQMQKMQNAKVLALNGESGGRHFGTLGSRDPAR